MPPGATEAGRTDAATTRPGPREKGVAAGSVRTLWTLALCVGDGVGPSVAVGTGAVTVSAGLVARAAVACLCGVGLVVAAAFPPQPATVRPISASQGKDRGGTRDE